MKGREVMKTTAELFHRLAQIEQAGYTRDQAIELVKVERLIVLNNQIKGLVDTIKSNEKGM